MPTFKDNTGHEWTVAITVATVKRLRDALNFDVAKAVDGKLLQELSADPVLLCDVLYVAVEEQAKAAGVSDEQFGGRLGGDSLEDATVALLDAIVNFSRPRQRAILQKVLTKQDQLMETAAEAIDARMNDGTLEAELRKQLEHALPPTSGG